MRLTEEKALFLKKEIQKYLPKAQIYLFGSRVDDTKKGGDIDLLVLADRVLDWKQKGDIKNAFWTIFGMQKLDLASFTHKEDTPFKKVALLDSILL